MTTGRPTAPVRAAELLIAARTAGVTLTTHDDGRTIDIDGPPNAEHLITALRRRPDLARHAVWVWTGAAPVLDWGGAHRAPVIDHDPTRPCRLCGKVTMLLDPWDRLPCHKLCLEQAIRPAASSETPAARLFDTGG